MFQVPLVFHDAPVAGKIAHLDDIALRKHFLDDPLKGIDGKGVFNEHGYRGSAFGEGDWVSTSTGSALSGRSQAEDSANRNRQKMILMPSMIASFASSLIGNGFGEIVALDIVASQTLEHVLLNACFYAFGHGGHVQRAGHGEDAPHHGFGVLYVNVPLRKKTLSSLMVSTGMF